MGELRVLHVLRDDHTTHVGGDLGDLLAVVAGLRHRGIDAVAATVDDAPDDVDLVHLYNLWLPDQILAADAAARARWPAARRAVTTIFWTYPLVEVLRARNRPLTERAVRRVVKGRTTTPAVRKLLIGSDLIVTKNNAEARLLERYFFAQGRLRTMSTPNAIDTAFWGAPAPTADRGAFLAAHALPPDTARVAACVARIEPRKNQLEIVRAMAQLDGWALLLVGPASPDDGYLASVLREGEARLGRRFAWLDRQPADAVLDVLHHTDVFVHPSFLESGTSNSSLEAAAAGCEVVLSPSATGTEIWGGLAHWCRPSSPSSIAGAIRSALETPRQPLARELAMRHTHERMATAIAAAYRGLVTGSPEARR